MIRSYIEILEDFIERIDINHFQKEFECIDINEVKAICWAINQIDILEQRIERLNERCSWIAQKERQETEDNYISKKYLKIMIDGLAKENEELDPGTIKYIINQEQARVLKELLGNYKQMQKKIDAKQKKHQLNKKYKKAIKERKKIRARSGSFPYKFIMVKEGDRGFNTDRVHLGEVKKRYATRKNGEKVMGYKVRQVFLGYMLEIADFKKANKYSIVRDYNSIQLRPRAVYFKDNKYFFKENGKRVFLNEVKEIEKAVKEFKEYLNNGKVEEDDD